MGLVQNEQGNWAHDDVPTHCENGHPFGPNRVFVSWDPGLGRVYECAQCGAITTRPPDWR